MIWPYLITVSYLNFHVDHRDSFLSLGIDPGHENILKKYNEISFYDAYSLYQITDKLNYIFSVEKVFFQNIRFQGVNFFQNSFFLKKIISKYAMGKSKFYENKMPENFFL